MGDDEELPDRRSDEKREVILHRFREARDYGLTRVEAHLFADSEIDVGVLRRLRALGCPPGQAAKILLCLLVSVVALLATGRATAANRPLHRFQTGKQVAGLQWILGGHRPSHFRIRAYTGRVSGHYNVRTAHAVTNMKYRLGWPTRAVQGSTAGPFFFAVLEGKVNRPTVYYQRATKRLADLKRVAAEQARTSCARNILTYARAEIGVHEIPWGSNYGPHAANPPPHGVSDFQNATGAYHAPWCVSFGQFIFKEAQVHSPRSWHGPIGENSAGAFYVAGWAQQHGWLRAIPKPAFFVVFRDFKGHFGIVESVSHTGFVSIEGNASNSVRENYHRFGARPEVFIAVPGCDTG